MQEREMLPLAEGEMPKPFREFFGIKETEKETPEQFKQRMLEAAQRKLSEPEINKFFQIRVGRNNPYPCGSGKKFKKCCWSKINRGEFEVKAKS